jgi:mannosylglycerate hydrolase MGH1-like protein
MTAEARRLSGAASAAAWKKWGPYLSERQWGTVREDYGAKGDAWNYLSHEHARSFAYRWGEDGLAGISDDQQTLCFALALWNGRDQILKERLFGLTNPEGNHGEDVKEYYFYLDSTPTHSYMRYLYKYPQLAFPYRDLVEINAGRSRRDFEYELIDTGVFREDRYFDLFVEYAKAGPEDLLIEISAHNRGPELATLHLLPTLWFRNSWRQSEVERPKIHVPAEEQSVLSATSVALGEYLLHCQPGASFLFADNETNPARWHGQADPSDGQVPRYFKDGINDYVVEGAMGAINPAQVGTKAAAHYTFEVPAQGRQTLRLRLCSASIEHQDGALGRRFSRVLETRKREADDFYAEIIPGSLSADRRAIVRQSLAGMLWSKQFYDYDVDAWLTAHGTAPSRATNGGSHRNAEWAHMVNADVISMPDKWEYPWYAAWDLAFHAVPLALVDPAYAKKQLLLLLKERYLHPNGQVPAYEWNFGDVNPPVHAWAAYFLYQLDKRRCGHGDLEFLKSIYNKLVINFTWWVNRKDQQGRNVFEGGFLGLDNIGVFDCSTPLPTGGRLEQTDGTAWMAFYAQAMLQISLELAVEDRSYVDMALNFFDHFVWIASSMIHIGGQGEMWNEEDGFFYDVLRTPDGRSRQLKVRSIVGLLPLCTAAAVDEQVVAALPELQQRARWFANHRPHLVSNIHDPRRPGYRDRRLLSLLSEERLRRVLAHVLDENEFLSPFGIRSLSRYHLDHPYTLNLDGQTIQVGYLPAESDSGLFGGNSNWRGPIWMPVNALLIKALINYYAYYGPSFRVEYPTGSGHRASLYEIAKGLTERLTRIFLRDKTGRRPVFGSAPKLSDDPLWRDHLLFYEYFHGDDGAGIGASHQTGWTGLIASLIHYFSTVSASAALNLWSPDAPRAAVAATGPRRRSSRHDRST